MKKYIKTIILMILTFILGIINVNAATKDLELVDVKVQGKTASITVEDVALNGNTVTSKIAFNKVNDFVAFELTIKNNDDEEYKVASVEDNNTSENLEISYIYNDSYIKKDETTSVTVKFKYVKELLDKEKISLDNLNIKINFEKADGKTSEVVVNPTPSISINPTTGVPLLRYIVVGLISILGLFLILSKKKNKIGTALLVLAVVAIPFSVLANEVFEISLKFSSVEVIGKEQTPPPTTATLANGGVYSIGGYGTFRKATLEEYNSVKDTLTEENVISTEDSEKKVYKWNVESDTLYYSEADIIYMNENSSYMFSDTNYASIDLSGLDSSKVTTMKGMFECCSFLQTLDITSFDTTNVTDMSYMFNNIHLEEIDISTFNTTNVTDMSYMFGNNNELKTIYVLDEWDTSKVTNYEGIFESCYNLVGENATIRYWEFDEYDIEYGYYMSKENYNDFDYAHLDGGKNNPGYFTLKGHDKDFAITKEGENFDYELYSHNIINGATYFRKATLAEYNSVKNTLTDDNDVSDNYSPIPIYMWQDGENALFYSPASTIYVNRNGYEMFSGTSYETIDLSGLDGSKLETMKRFFYYSTSLKEIIFGDFDTSNVIDMSEMFYECDNLKTLDLSSFDTSNVINMGSMFSYCMELKELDISSFDTSNVIDMGYMFEECENLEELDLSSFNIGNVQSMYAMFEECHKLHTIYVSNLWDISNVNDSSSMFYDTYNLVGEKGTIYDGSYNNDISYAHVDGGTSDPGYFTLKGHNKEFTIMLPGYSDDDSFNSKLTAMNTTNKDFRKATTSEYNLIKDTLTEDDVVSLGSSKKVYMWETSDSILYYSDATTIYLNAHSETMFYNSNLKTIDMSGFNTTIMENVENMFYNCSNLNTIYVSNSWDMSNVYSSSDMFYGTYNLVGEKGTTYDDSYSNDGSYAFVDEGPSNPGYFTLKGHNKDFAFMLPGYSYDDSFNNKLTAMNTTNKDFRKATIAEYNSAKNTLTEDNIVSTSYSPKDIYMWETNDSILYYSTANTIYLNVNSEEMFRNSKLKTIDISDFDISQMKDIDSMFANCSNLDTIYTSGSWDMSNFDSYSYTFEDSYSLVGEQGTIYDKNGYNYNGDYARIDGGSSNPGYFTLKGHTKEFAFLDYGDSFNAKIKSMNTMLKEFRKATLEEYNSVKNSLTDANIASASNSPYPIYMWETNDYVLYYSEINKIYLNGDSSALFFETDFRIIDISDFDITYVYNIDYMFEYCYYLVIIYADESTDMSEVEDVWCTFEGSYNIIGEQGTLGSSQDGDYARIDGGPSKPGLFTRRGHVPDIAFLLDGDELSNKLNDMDTENKEFRKATAAEYNLVKDSLNAVNNEISASNSPYYVYAWETEDSILYYSMASTIYLPENSSYMFGYTGFKTIDLSGFDNTYINYTQSMFANCEYLTTIYVPNGWDLSNASDSYDMFSYTENLVGGAGTAYDEYHEDGEYAKIDGGSSDPGYFTDIADKQ